MHTIQSIILRAMLLSWMVSFLPASLVVGQGKEAVQPRSGPGSPGESAAGKREESSRRDVAQSSNSSEKTSPEKSSTEKSSTATPGQIQQWIVDLGAQQFDVRDHATQNLMAAGAAAIDPLLEPIRGGDREMAMRAVIAIQEIGARGDAETLQSSLAALEQAVKHSGSLLVSRHAAEALQSLTAVRQDRAIEYLRKLGATITYDMNDRWYQQMARFPFPAPVLSVEFGLQWKGEDEDLERLTWIKEVEQVSFVGPRVKDSWFRYLRNLPKLHSVRVKRAPITNAGLSEIAQIEGIWFLRLMFVSLDDSAVPILKNSRSVRKLMFISRQLTEPAIADLRLQLGKDNLETPHGALLGIMASDVSGESWRVTSVIPESAADKAGILENDRIVKLNDHPITDFATLRAHISRNEPGDTVTMEILRGLDRLTKQVTFGELD